MQREEFGDLAVFLAVAQERSFTKAATRLNTSQSALSHVMRRMEARLGIKLLARTTRSVSPTEAGQQLLDTLAPAMGDISAKLEALGKLRDAPAGLVRITCSRHAADTVLWPAVDRVLARYHDVQVELSIDGALTNIVTDRFDAGVRLGEHVEKDMIALRIGPELRMAVVASPAYWADHPMPSSPRDLTAHRCINLRMATRGNLYIWEFEKDASSLNVRVDGAFIVNDMATAIRAAKAGHGVAYVMADQAAVELEHGHLVPVLNDWCPPFAGHHLYYPDRHDLSPAFAVLLQELRKGR